MQVTEEQKQKVIEWVRAGASLSDVQRKLSDECGLALTYMDVRFLIIDLELQVKDKQQPAPAKPMAAPAPTAPPDAPDADFADELPPPGGAAVRVELDRVVKPGSVVSGSVTFGDGVTGAWSLDQLGRLALSASQPGYRPSPEDVQAFQSELRRALEKRGF